MFSLVVLCQKCFSKNIHHSTTNLTIAYADTLNNNKKNGVKFQLHYINDSLAWFDESSYKDLKLNLIEITENEFNQIESNYNINCELEGNFIIGFDLYFTSECREICKDLLVDKRTRNKIILPTSFDEGILGIFFSPSCNQFLVYSSYYMPIDFGYRSEIYWFNLTQGEGLNAVEPSYKFHSYDWSIEKVIWVNDKTIAIKTYEGTRWGDGEHLDFIYYKAVFK